MATSAPPLDPEHKLKTYHGNCHCGAFKYTVTAPHIDKFEKCDCSYCTKTGYMWVKPHTFEIVKGKESDLKTYAFGSKALALKFCPSCGTNLFARTLSSNELTLNARTIAHSDLDLSALTAGPLINGKDRGTPYQPPPPAPTHLVPDEAAHQQLHRGNCHCGAVRYTLRAQPPAEWSVNSCNCSICARVLAWRQYGTLWLYPLRSDVDIRGQEHLTRYRPGPAHGFSFCGTCGVTVGHSLASTEGEEMGLNMRSWEGDVDGLKVYEEDGWGYEPQYKV